MRLDTTEGKDKKKLSGHGRTAEDGRIGTEHADYVNYEKLERRNLPTTNFVPEDSVDRARERTTSRRRRYISSEKTMGERRKKGRKGRSRRRGRSARGRRVYPRVTAIDLMRKMLGAAQKSTPGKVAYIPGFSPSLFVCFVFARAFVVLVRGRCRRRRCRRCRLPLSFPPPSSLIVFLHFTTAALRYSDIGIACYSASSLSASFDPLNLAGGRPAISRKLVKSRTY